jgi:DNA polymerase-3 subunit alpha
MKIVQDMAGYDLGMADTFRRAIGRKIPEEMAELIPKFVNGCREKGVPEDIAKELAEWLSNAAAYQFNKSHSAAYGVTCYQTAYLKANYTAEYLCAYMNAYMGDKQEDLIPYIQDIKRHGIKLLPPDARSKSLGWQLEEVDGEKAIRMAISYITGVGKIPVPLDEESFWRLNKTKAENLIKSGAVDFLGDRKELLDKLYTSGLLAKLQKQLETAKERMEKNKAEYEDAKEGTKRKAEAYRKMMKYDEQYWETTQKIEEAGNTGDFDKAKAEMEVLGMTFENPFESYDISKFKEPDESDSETRMVLGVVRRIKHWKQKNGKPMMFFSIECPSGKLYDLVIFNYVYTPLELNTVYKMTIQNDKFKRLL